MKKLIMKIGTTLMNLSKHSFVFKQENLKKFISLLTLSLTRIVEERKHEKILEKP